MKINLLKIGLSIIISFLFFGLSYGQYSKGLVFDDNAYEAVPKKATLTLKSYAAVPSSASLKIYCPEVSNQGSHGTCVGWASAWAARTILYAKNHSISSQSEITKIAFAPLFVYHYSKADNDADNCKKGAYISRAMSTMKDVGVPSFNDFPEFCVQSIPSDIRNKASENKIKDFNTIFSINSGKSEKINASKNALSNGYPIVIGAICPESMYSVNELWVPTELPDPSYGGHAMCVIGYDDDKFGGAFELMNSWGKEWANNGFFWVRYDDYAKFVKYGFEIYPKEDKPINIVDLSGKVIFQKSNGDKLNVKLNKIAKKGQTVVSDEYESVADYKITKALSSGAKYRLYINNNEPAYVYVISSDLKNNTAVLFPHDKGVSPYLSYTSNEIAIPGENYSIQLDNNPGIDYTCILYSKEELNIDEIISKIKSSSDSFENNIYKAVGNKLVAKKDVDLNDNEVSFEAKSKGKTVVAIIVEIEHI